MATLAVSLRWPVWAGVLVGLVAIALGVVWWVGPATRIAQDSRAGQQVGERRERPVVAAREETPRTDAAQVAPPAQATPGDKAPVRDVPPSQQATAEDKAPEPARRRDLPTADAKRSPALTEGAQRTLLSKRDVSDSPARVAVAQPRQPEVEQARARTMTARREAEQVAASFYAPKLFASAQTKE